MFRILVLGAFLLSTVISGCVVYDEPQYRYRDHRGADWDRDGVPNRVDRDRDGDRVPNRYDRRPNDPRRY
jgi:hypothetical protein